MFDWIKDLFIWLRDELQLGVTIEHYNRGVRLRLGKHIRPGIKFFKWRLFKLSGKVMKPGWHWKLPFIDDINTVMVKTTTMDLSEQTVTTRNSVQLVIEAAVKYDVSNPVKLMLEVGSATDALADMSKGIIRNTLVHADWPQCNGDDYSVELTDRIRTEAAQWGIRVKAVTIISMAPMRSIRLLTSYNYKNNEAR
jgi:regulator of protease activity HflC (stomatin/prohibitin superfamily)